MDQYAEQNSASRIVSFRVNPDEYRKLKKISLDSGMTLSSMLRQLFTNMENSSGRHIADRHRA